MRRLLIRSLDKAIRVNLSLPDFPVSQEGEWTCISHTDILAKASPTNGQPYSVVKDRVTAQDGCVGFEIPACSVNMVWFKGRDEEGRPRIRRTNSVLLFRVLGWTGAKKAKINGLNFIRLSLPKCTPKRNNTRDSNSDIRDTIVH